MLIHLLNNFFYGSTAPIGSRFFSLFRFHEHTQIHQIRYDCPGRVISPTQRPLPDKTRDSQERERERERNLCPAGFKPAIPTSERRIRSIGQ
jgi:hypothetical protein